MHGIVHDTIEFVKGIIRVEMNSATDNPLVFADREDIISGGNFHGEYPAKASTLCVIAIEEHLFLGSGLLGDCRRRIGPDEWASFGASSE